MLPPQEKLKVWLVSLVSLALFCAGSALFVGLAQWLLGDG